MDEPATAATVLRDVVCPFCSLGCDDLTIAAEGASLRLVGPDCPVAAAGFGRAAPPDGGGPTVDGAPATPEAAVARAAELLRGAALPMFGGLGTDVAGLREVLALAERTGGVVDHAGSRGLLANLRATQDGGAVTATLAEVRNRADLALVVATDVAAVAPRFAERCLAPRAGLFGPLARALVHLGPGEPLPGAEVIPCEPDRVGEALAALRALAAGARVTAAAGGVPVPALADLAARLKAAAYPVVVWAARDLTGPHPDLAAAALAGLLRDLNAKGRCCGVPLAGPDNVVGANQVCGWQTGVPLRTSFASGAPDHDPVRWSTAAALAAADRLVWVSAIGTQPLPLGPRPPAVALLRPGHPLPGAGVAVAIPVGTPGVDHAGSTFRTDGVVALPLRALRETRLPSVAQVLAAIRAGLEAA